MSLHIALIGKTGQLARAVLHEGSALGHQVTALDRSQLDLSWRPADIESTAFDFIKDYDVLILAAAYTNVDGAETDSETAHAVNGVAPGAIAKACARRSIPMVHISTDYVFGGQNKTPYKPEDPTAPLGVYGTTKLAGEQAVLKSGAKALILRTSWVFDGTGKNFMTTMLRLSETRDALSVVKDQIGRPTFAGDLARASLRAADALVKDKEMPPAVYHVTNTGEPISWAQFAIAIFKAADKTVAVKEIPSSEYPTPVERPAYSVLDTQDFETDFDFDLPNWQSGLMRALGYAS